jgi:hypothetical protein
MLCVVSSLMEIDLSQFQTYENVHFGEGGIVCRRRHPVLIMAKLTSWCRGIYVFPTRKVCKLPSCKHIFCAVNILFFVNDENFKVLRCTYVKDVHPRKNLRVFPSSVILQLTW